MADAYVLVDYDNIPQNILKYGNQFVFKSIVDKFLEQLDDVPLRHLRLRFYGGWYNGTIKTQRAQKLLHHSTFITPETRKQIETKQITSFKSELAESLLSSHGGIPFHFTCRTRPFPLGRYRADLTGHSMCDSDPCFLGVLNEFFSSGKCLFNAETTEVFRYILSEEQKLVDVLLATDLLWLSRRDERIGIVTSDDDLWPAIISVCENESVKSLVHIQTQSPTSTASTYARLVNKKSYKLTLL